MSLLLFSIILVINSSPTSTLLSKSCISKLNFFEEVEKILHLKKETKEEDKEIQKSESAEENKTKKEEEPKDLIEASMEENKEEKKQ